QEDSEDSTLSLPPAGPESMGSDSPPSAIRVTDRDLPGTGGPPFLWTIVEGDNLRYRLNDGRLSVGQDTQFRPGAERLRVQVCDSGASILCNTATVIVRAIRSNVAPPRLQPLNATAVFLRPPERGVRLADLSLLDGDGIGVGPGVRIRLRSHADLFDVSPSGALLVANGNR
uniref:Cadherin domain-containing protein n=1 Tax=Macrostomum lignano TaxID=282301 RepID=A0A1I8JEC0_9PLAT